MTVHVSEREREEKEGQKGEGGRERERNSGVGVNQYIPLTCVKLMYSVHVHAYAMSSLL